jgi:hypothetical protein
MSKIRLTAVADLATPHSSSRVRKLLPVPGLAEDAVRPLDEAPQVHADRNVHVERLADLEVRLVGLAEDAGEVLLVGVEHLREMGRHGPNRARAFFFGHGRLAGEHQHRLDLEGAVRGRAGQDGAQERLVRGGRIGLDVLIGRVEADVGHEAEEVVALAGDPHESPDAQLLDRRQAVQACGQPLDQRARDDQTEPILSHTCVSLDQTRGLAAKTLQCRHAEGSEESRADLRRSVRSRACEG